MMGHPTRGALILLHPPDHAPDPPPLHPLPIPLVYGGWHSGRIVKIFFPFLKSAVDLGDGGGGHVARRYLPVCLGSPYKFAPRITT